MERETTEPIVPDSTTDDYEEARKNMFRLLAKGEDALNELGEIAYISQHPRAYEVYSNLFKSLVDTNKELLGLKKTNKEITGASDGPKTINNNLIMTSDEVLRMLKDKRRE